MEVTLTKEPGSGYRATIGKLPSVPIIIATGSNEPDQYHRLERQLRDAAREIRLNGWRDCILRVSYDRGDNVTTEVAPVLVEHSARSCARCEYFNGGGARKVESAIETGVPLHGDCLNRLSPRFQTTSDDTCPVWIEAT